MTTPPADPPRRRVRHWLVLGLEIATVGYIAFHLWRSRERIAAVWDLAPADLAGLLLLVVAGNLATTWLFQGILRPLGLRLPFAEAWALTVGTTLLNYLPFNAGLFVRARVLKRHRGFSYTRYVSMMGATALLSVLAGGALGLIALAAAAPGLGGGAAPLVGTALFFAAAVAAPLVLLHLPARRLEGSGRWLWRRVHDLLLGWEEIRRSRATLALLCCGSAAQLLIVAARLWICFRVFGLATGFDAALIFASIATLATLVSLTPSGLGVRELLVGALVGWFGLDFTQGTAAAGLDRVVVLLFVVPAGLAGLLYLRRAGLLGAEAAVTPTPDRGARRRRA